MIEPETPPAAVRLCGRCGQPINPQKDSWKMKNNQMQHVTCPTGPELQNLPSSPSGSPELGRGGLPAAPALITMDEAAQLIRVSKGTIRNYIKAGKLPAKRLNGGQKVLIERRDVLALLEDITPDSGL